MDKSNSENLLFVLWNSMGVNRHLILEEMIGLIEFEDIDKLFIHKNIYNAS